MRRSLVRVHPVSTLFPVWNALLPDQVTTTERLGRAMLAAAKGGAPKPVLETRDLNELALGPPGDRRPIV